MAYTRSLPLSAWLTARREAIDVLAAAHAGMGEIDGPGRPRELGRPVAHAYILRVVAEFQAFVRDLHDLGAERMVVLAQPTLASQPILIAAATEGRAIDRDNADARSIESDFRRLGITGLNGRLQAANPRWAPQNGPSDRAAYQRLIELRNALAHGNQGQVDRLRSQGTVDTVTWARRALPSLNRTARALDRVVWHHWRQIFGVDPW